MEFDYSSYDAKKAIIITSSDKTLLLAYPKNMNPFKNVRMACYRNENNQVVISLMEGNSEIYTQDGWNVLCRTPPLKQQHENKMMEIIASAQEAETHFLKEEQLT